jgi:hypothetical protein
VARHLPGHLLSGYIVPDGLFRRSARWREPDSLLPSLTGVPDKVGDAGVNARAVSKGQMNGADGSPTYVARGPGARPLPTDDPRRSSWRGSLILLAVMFGWLFLVVVLAAVAAPNDPNHEVPTDVGLGVVVTPADGWYSAQDVWDVGANAVSFQKGGSFIAFAAEDFAGSNEALLDEQLGTIAQDFQSYRVLPPSATTVAGEVPGLMALFTGVSDSSRLEGEVVAATSAGVGVIMLVISPQGQLSRAQNDLDSMLQSLQVPR